MTLDIIRVATESDIAFLAATDLRVDDETGETYHRGWSSAERVAHEARIGRFVREPSTHAAWVAQAPHDASEGNAGGKAERDAKVGAVMCRFHDLNVPPEDPVLAAMFEVVAPHFPAAVGGDHHLVCEIFQLWVAPSLRRRGLGSALKARVEVAAKLRGMTLLYTHTQERHTHVIALNLALGYREVRRGPLWDEVTRVSLAKVLEENV